MNQNEGFALPEFSVRDPACAEVAMLEMLVEKGILVREYAGLAAMTSEVMGSVSRCMLPEAGWVRGFSVGARLVVTRLPRPPGKPMKLYRPTGLRELVLLVESGFTAWPPRLPDQPIFYPVLTLDYARKIARDWNAVDAFSGHVGFVTEFDLEPAFAARYPIQDAGGRSHRELWIPAEELPEMNRHIQGKIRVIEVYPGPRFEGEIDPATLLPREIGAIREP